MSRKRVLLFTAVVFIALGCFNQSETMSLYGIDKNNKYQSVAEVANKDTILSFFESSRYDEFQKIILEQSNGDNFIVEQKDELGYLILLKLRYEQFVIQKRPKTIEEVRSLMLQYLAEKDAIMKTTKFY